jgi:hypothetical protein
MIFNCHSGRYQQEKMLGIEQGDEIGGIFVYWVIVSFGQFFEN